MRLLRSFLVLCFAFPAVFEVAAQYTYAMFDVPNSRQTIVLGTNNNGWIVEIYQDASLSYRGFLYNGSSFADISYPGSPVTHPMAVNDNGVIVGFYMENVPTNQRNLAFMRSAKGTYHTLPIIPGANVMSANGINNGGAIVGEYDLVNDASGVLGHSFVYSKGKYQFFENLWISDINDKNMMTGTIPWYTGFIRTKSGAITEFDAPYGPNNTHASSIDRFGRVVGSFFTDSTEIG